MSSAMKTFSLGENSKFAVKEKRLFAFDYFIIFPFEDLIDLVISYLR